MKCIGSVGCGAIEWDLPNATDRESSERGSQGLRAGRRRWRALSRDFAGVATGRISGPNILLKTRAGSSVTRHRLRFLSRRRNSQYPVSSGGQPWCGHASQIGGCVYAGTDSLLIKSFCRIAPFFCYCVPVPDVKVAKLDEGIAEPARHGMARHVLNFGEGVEPFVVCWSPGLTGVVPKNYDVVQVPF